MSDCTFVLLNALLEDGRIAKVLPIFSVYIITEMFCLGRSDALVVLDHDGPNGPLRLALNNSTPEVCKKKSTRSDATSTLETRPPLARATADSGMVHGDRLPGAILPLHRTSFRRGSGSEHRRAHTWGPLPRPRAGHPRPPRACSCPMTPTGVADTGGSTGPWRKSPLTSLLTMAAAP
jgi:hypothetical protein